MAGFARGMCLAVPVGLAAGASALTLLAVRALAAGVPETGALTYAGYLEDGEGIPLKGDYAIEVQFWGSETAGQALCVGDNSDNPSVPSGRFQIALPPECEDAVKGSPDLWVEVKVDGGLLGRTKLGAVPYALEAGRAATADVSTRLGSSGEEDFATADHSHTFSSLTGVPAGLSDGDQDTTYTPGLGLALNGTTFSADPADDANDALTVSSSGTTDVTTTTAGPKGFLRAEPHSPARQRCGRK